MAGRMTAERKIDEARRRVQEWGQTIARRQEWDWHLLGQALQLGHEAIEAAPDYQRAWTFLADTYHRIGDDEFAEKCLEKSYSLATPGPNFPGRFYKSVKNNLRSGYPFNRKGGLTKQSQPNWFTEKYQRYLVIEPSLWGKEEPAVEHSPLDPNSVFISYSHTDWDDYVKSFVDQLQSHDVPVWIDQHYLKYGVNWLDEVNQALQTCHRLVVCATPAAMQSRYVKMEYQYFFLKDKPIYLIMCETVDLPAELQAIHQCSYAELGKLCDMLAGSESTDQKSSGE